MAGTVAFRLQEMISQDSASDFGAAGAVSTGTDEGDRFPVEGAARPRAGPTPPDRTAAARRWPAGRAHPDRSSGADGAGQAALEASAGALRHVVLTAGGLRALAAPFRSPGVAVRVGGRPTGCRTGLSARALPGAGGEVALLLSGVVGRDGGGLLLTGDALRVVGQTPVYREGAAPPIAAYLELVAALRALEPAVLAPAHQAPALVQVVRATAWAAGSGAPPLPGAGRPGERSPLPRPRGHTGAGRGDAGARRRPPGGAPLAPPPGAAGAAGVWGAAGSPTPSPAPVAARPNPPLRQTCSGPGVPRLCATCRVRCGSSRWRRACWSARAVAVPATAPGPWPAPRGQALAALDLAGRVEVVPVRCIGRCALGPVRPGGDGRRG